MSAFITTKKTQQEKIFLSKLESKNLFNSEDVHYVPKITKVSLAQDNKLILDFIDNICIINEEKQEKMRLKERPLKGYTNFHQLKKMLLP